jgi:hypothetical protein
MLSSQSVGVRIASATEVRFHYHDVSFRAIQTSLKKIFRAASVCLDSTFRQRNETELGRSQDETVNCLK